MPFTVILGGTTPDKWKVVLLKHKNDASHVILRVIFVSAYYMWVDRAVHYSSLVSILCEMRKRRVTFKEFIIATNDFVSKLLLLFVIRAGINDINHQYIC